jgi:hypothetical protein
VIWEQGNFFFACDKNETKLYKQNKIAVTTTIKPVMSVKKLFKKIRMLYYWKCQGQAPVAHACNPSYSSGRDQEDCGLKPAQANSLQDPILRGKKKSQNRAGGVTQGVGPEFKPQYWKKKRKENVYPYFEICSVSYLLFIRILQIGG